MSKGRFSDRERIASHHYAFKVSEAEFDEIFARIQAEGIAYGSGPYSHEDMQINHRGGGRGVYFCDPTGMSLNCSLWSSATHDHSLLHASIRSGLKRTRLRSCPCLGELEGVKRPYALCKL